MIGAVYGALPIAHAVGGLRDTVHHLNPEQHTGNGFLFETYDSGGLFWAIQQAMTFYHLPAPARSDQISRIMTEGTGTFNHKMTARHYIDLYHKLLRDPVVERMKEEIVID
jgi:starch synthase/alpha-amylase